MPSPERARVDGHRPVAPAGHRRVTVAPGRAARLGVLLALLAALAGACSNAAPSPGAPGAAPSPGAPGAARLPDCGGVPQDRPSVVVLTCSEGAITARSLTWSGWGSKIATATGSAVVNMCAYQDCHTGSYRSYPMVLVASGTEDCPGGLRGYARLQYLFVGTSPFQGLPAAMKVPPQWWGPAGVGKPLVSRPCR